MKYFNLPVRGTVGIFPKNKLFIHGWAYFKFFIAISSKNMLNKVAIWFIFTQFTMEVLIQLLSWPFAILRSKFSGIVSIVRFSSCIEESPPTSYTLFLVETLKGIFWKGFFTAWRTSCSFKLFHSFFSWLLCFNSICFLLPSKLL